MSGFIAWSVVAGVGLGFGLWSLASLAPRLSRPSLARRVAPYLVDVSDGARQLLAPAPPGPLPVVGMLLEPLAIRGRRALGSLLGGSDLLARRLRQSGSALTVDGFRSQQLLWGVGGAAVGVVLAAFVVRVQGIPLLAQASLVVAAAAAGVVARDQLLQHTARRRLARLTSELPVILEFLTLSLSAGEGILDAIRRVARTSSGELAGELATVVAAVNTGLPFAGTLRQLATSLDLAPLTRCVDQITGALDRGTPLGEVLRAQAQDARDDAKRELLEVAGRREVSMLFPLVFLILPVTVLFAIFPGIFVLQLGL